MPQYPEYLKRLISSLHATGIPMQNIGVAGGYARDVYLGHVPNDIDVIIVGCPELTAADFFHPSPLYLDKESPVVLYGYTEGGFGDSTDRWTNIIQFGNCAGGLHPDAPGLGVDILVAQGAYKTLADVVHHFDFNINQFCAPAISVLNDVRPGFWGRYFGSLHISENPFVAERIAPERQAYMREKAHKYGWVVGCTPS